MDNRLKRFLSLALAMVMVIGMMPTNIVFATGNVEGQDPAQVETPTQETTAPSEPVQTPEASEPEETTVHICSFDTEEITKAAGAREAGQKTLSCSCGASKTEKICADDCQLTEGHEDDCVLACDRNPGCIDDENHDGPCVSEEGALLIGSAEELEAAMAAIANRNAVTFAFGGDLTTDLKLTADIALSSTFVVPAGYNIAVDLAGYQMSTSGQYALHNKGTLVINDTKRTVNNETVNGEIRVTSGDYAALYNEGTATVNSGVFVSAQSYALDNRTNATLNVNGGSASGINNFEGTANISGGTHYNKADRGHVLRNQNGTMNITGGSFTNDNPETETVLIESGTVQISGETLFSIQAATGTAATSPLFEIKPLAAGLNTSVTINGGRFRGGFYVDAGAYLTINDGYFHDIHKSDYTVVEDGKIRVTIYGGNFQDTNAQTFAAKNLRDGFIVKANGNEVVKNGNVLSPVVAKIRYQNDEGDYGYASLAEAVSLAYDNATINVIRDDTVNSTINVTKNLTIELGNHTITSMVVGASNVEDGYLFRLTGNDCDTFTLNNGVFVSGSDSDYGVIDINAAANVTVNGGKYNSYITGTTGKSSAYGVIFKGRFVGTNEYASIALNGVEVSTNHYVFNNDNAAMASVTVTGGTYTSKDYGAFNVDVKTSASFTGAAINGAVLGVAVEGPANENQKATATFENNTIKITNPTSPADIGELKNFVIGIASNVYATVESGTYGSADYANEKFGLTTSGTGNSLTIKNGTFDGMIYAPDTAGEVEIERGTFNNFAVNGNKLTITCDGGKFDADPTRYLLQTLEWIRLDATGVADADKGKVKVKDVRVTNTDEALVQGVSDRSKVQDILDQIKYSYALRDTNPTGVPDGGALKIALKKLAVNESLVPTEIVYDVKVEGVPVNNNVTFYLPVPTAVTAGHVKVYHNEDLLGVFPVKDSSNEKYVEVVSSKFSDYTLIPVAYEAGVTKVYIGTNGYKTLEEALLDAKARIEAAPENEKEALKTIVVEIVGDVVFSKAAEGFKKITFNGIDGKQTLNMMIGGSGAAFDTTGAIEFNYLTLSRPDREPTGRLVHTFNVRGGLTYNDCKLHGLFSVSAQNTTFNRCHFINNGNNNDMANDYTLWLYNSKDVVVNVVDCIFDVTNRAIKMYAYNMNGNMTLNISNTRFTAEQGQNSKTVVEMTFEDCNGDAVMLLNIDDKSTKTNFGAPEHIEEITATNSWFNSEIRGTDANKGAVVTINNSIVYNDCEAKIGNQYYTTLQKAIDAVKNGETIHLIKDTNANVTVKQEAGKSFTINGVQGGFYSTGLPKASSGKATFSGTINLEGNSRHTGAETLTIKNIKFSTNSAEAHDFISCNNSTNTTIRYAHNVTVQNCDFECTNRATTNAVVGMRFRQCYNMTVVGCTATNMHSLIWANGGAGMSVTGCSTTEGSTFHEGGVNVGTCQNTRIENCNFKGMVYGVRADGSAATTLTIKGCTLNADIPVYIRNLTAENYTLVMEGANTLTAATGKTGIVLNKAATITGEYDAGEQPTIRAIVELNGTGLTADDITGEVQTSGKRNFTKVTEAAIVKKYFDTLGEAITAAATGETIDLLRDIEVTENVVIGKAITVNGKLAENAAPYTIKAKSGTTWSTRNPYLVKISAAATLKNTIVDGNRIGCRGIQLTGSKVDATLENITVKNITADTNGCDYAVMADVRNLTVNGTLKFEGCKYGRMVIGGTYATKATAATLTGVKVNLENINIKTQTGSELTVAKNNALDVQTHVKGHHVEYEGNKYKLKIDNTVVLDYAYAIQEANRSRIYIELKDVYVGNSAEPAKSKITVKLYTADGKLISTTTNNQNSSADLPCVLDKLGVNIVLGGEAGSASSSWTTVFNTKDVSGHPRADMPASHFELYLNDNEEPVKQGAFADGKVPVRYTGINEQNPVDWDELKYVNRVVKQTKNATTNETTSVYYTTLSDAVAAAAEGDTLMLLGDIVETDLVTIDEKITLDLNSKTISCTGTADNTAVVQIIAQDVTIKNGSIQITNKGAAIWASADSKVTLNNVTVTGATSSVELYKGAKVIINSGAINGEIVLDYNETTDAKPSVEITGGTFTNSGLDEDNAHKECFEISGGIFDKEVPVAMCKNGYICKVIENSNPVRYQVVENPYTQIDLNISANEKVTVNDTAYAIVQAGGKAFVDGKEFDVEDNLVILLDNETAQKKSMFITTYIYSDGETANNGKLAADNVAGVSGMNYPETMHVWFAEGKNPVNGVYTSYDVTRVAELDNLFMYEGTSIRIGGSDNGIRFISSIHEATASKLMNGTMFNEGPLVGADMVTVGTWFKRANEARSLVYDSSSSESFSTYAKGGGRIYYTGVLTGLGRDKDVVAPPFLTRPFADIKIVKGNDAQVVTLYGGMLNRSIPYVASQNIGQFPAGSTYDKFVKDLAALDD